MKKLNELTQEEAKELYTKNEFLRKMCNEEAETQAEFLTDDILAPFRKLPGVDYEINCYGGYSYFKVRQNAYSNFIDACLEHPYEWIIEEATREKLKRAEKKAEFFTEATNGYIDISDKNYNRLEKWIDSIIEAATGEIIAAVTREYEYSYSEEAAAEMLDIVTDTDKYETDGQFIYETEKRKYA